MKTWPWWCWSVCVLAGCATDSGRDSASVNSALPARYEEEKLDTARIDAGKQQVMLGMVRDLQAKQQHYAALAQIRAYELQWGRSPELTLMQAESLRQTQQYMLAGDLYQRLLASPLEGLAYKGLGLMAAQQKQMNNAAKWLEEAALRLPADPDVQSDLGYAWLVLGRVKSAEVALKTAAELVPEEPRYAANLATYYLRMGDVNQARRWLSHPKLSDQARQAAYDLAQALRNGKVTEANSLRQ